MDNLSELEIDSVSQWGRDSILLSLIIQKKAGKRGEREKGKEWLEYHPQQQGASPVGVTESYSHHCYSSPKTLE